MAEQENTKPVTDHLNDTLARIAQAQAVLRSLTNNCAKDDEGIHFGDLMEFEDVTAILWAVDTLLGQAKDFCNDGFRAAYEKRYSNAAPIKTGFQPDGQQLAGMGVAQ